jgi:predicted permease
MQAGFAALLKVMLAPTTGFFAAKAMGLEHEQIKIALIYLACPSAAMSYVLTNQIGGNDTLAASTVIISTILAIFSLGYILAF